jgi:transposase
MENQDQRKLSPETKYELRKQVVRLKKSGRSTPEVAEITGLRRQSVNRVWRMFQSGGQSAIKERPMGRQAGEKRRLSPDQESRLQRLMVDKTPEQLRFKFALWTRAAVQAVSLREFGVDLPLRTISHYLKRWGFTVQKPVVRAYEKNPKAVSDWLLTTYPSIRQRAKEEGGEIHWGDETGVEASDYARGGFAPKGRTPVLVATGKSKKTRVNMISSITNRGQVRFMLYEEKMTSKIFIKFMSRLAKDSEKKVFLIVDNLSVHHSLTVKEWLAEESNRKRIEIFHLPSYSPELNPDERLNSDLKGQIRSGPVAFTKTQVKQKIRSGMKIIQNNPARVRKYFEDPNIAYAA